MQTVAKVCTYWSWPTSTEFHVAEAIGTAAAEETAFVLWCQCAKGRCSATCNNVTRQWILLRVTRTSSHDVGHEADSSGPRISSTLSEGSDMIPAWFLRVWLPFVLRGWRGCSTSSSASHGCRRSGQLSSSIQSPKLHLRCLQLTFVQFPSCQYSPGSWKSW